MDSAAATIDCAICLESIVPQPAREGEKQRILDCSHIFHRECIGAWVKKSHDCPMCRAPVKEEAPEAPQSEKLELPRPQAPLPVIPDYVARNRAMEDVRAEIRHVRLLNLNENTPVAQTARKVHAIAGRVFGFAG